MMTAITLLRTKMVQGGLPSSGKEALMKPRAVALQKKTANIL
jgi:hypothetical protein